MRPIEVATRDLVVKVVSMGLNSVVEGLWAEVTRNSPSLISRFRELDNSKIVVLKVPMVRWVRL